MYLEEYIPAFLIGFFIIGPIVHLLWRDKETCGFCKKPCGNDWCVTRRNRDEEK